MEQRQSSEVEILHESLSLLQMIPGSIIGSRPITENLQDHARRVCRALRADYCIIRRLVDRRLQLIGAYGVDLNVLDPDLGAPLGIAESIIEAKQTIALRNVHENETAKTYFHRPNALKIVSYAGSPMLVGEEVIGIVGVYTSEDLRDFTDTDLELLAALAGQATVCLRNQELYEELQEINQSLDERVQSRTEELQRANQELEAFTYTVAHDLRAPLRSIIANSQILMQEYGAEIPQKAKVYIERQAVSAKRLATMMDGLLSLARLGRQSVQSTHMNLSRLAEDVSVECVRAHSACPPRINVEPDIFVTADARLMRILLLNLFENAVKFAKDGQRALISVRTDPSNPEVSFVVEDQGIGFEPQYAEKLFLPFERLVRQDEYPGTGIGLASVKRIIDKHGGSISATGEIGVGARFLISL